MRSDILCELTMCYGNPVKSLAIARARMTPEQWARFEREFEDFCVVSGLEGWMYAGSDAPSWIKWAYLSARPIDGKGADERIRDAFFEKIAIASMTNEQAQRSLQRFSMWQRMKGETA